jgi:1-acyl-sn-glycerol-3-phosphate acyltransferase
MRSLVGAWRLARVLVHGLHGLAIVLARFRSYDAATRHARIQWWSVKLLRVMGLRLQISGVMPKPGAKLVVSNHVSWLDIAAIHAVIPEAHFVSKADVKHWPLVGRLVAGAGTLFIEREKKRDALRVVHQVAEALARGETVAVFPEGTTGDGRTLLPFHANLLQAAVAAKAPVQPVVLRFFDAEHAISPLAEFLGETTMAQSLWRFVKARGLNVEVRVLAEHLRELIGAALPRA